MMVTEYLVLINNNMLIAEPRAAWRRILRSAVNIPPQECCLGWPGDQHRNPKAEDLW